jgi:mono/diheme cytochrome c family protein
MAGMMRCSTFRSWAARVIVALNSAWLLAQSPPANPDKTVVFETSVLPIFQASCVPCHGSALKMKELDLSTFGGVIKGGEDGPVLTPGKPQESRLYEMVEKGAMPKGGKPLAPSQIASIREWIEAGARSGSPTLASNSAPVTQDDVLPIFLLRCGPCHGLRRQEGGLALHTRAAMFKGGKSGKAIMPGRPEDSLIAQKLRSGEMPPKLGLDEISTKRITKPEIDRVVAWIAQGAPEGKPPDAQTGAPDPLVSDKDRQFWAFRPPRRPVEPAVKNRDRVRNPIDLFVLSKLEAKGLSLAPEAGKLTLIRRAYYDLTGLPPSPAEVQAFLADSQPDAYDKLIDRLLASPGYGERWGRDWLDLSGYADSEGGKLAADPIRPVAWRYRDYVIRSFNADKPYDRFLLEQFAGDELMDYEHAPVVTAEMMDNLIATGFLRMGPDSTNDRATNSVEDRLDVIADEMDIIGSGIMGLTIRCARCHSHKYDPLPQRDYYRMVDVFKGAFDYYDWQMPQKDPLAKIATPIRYLPYVIPGAAPMQLMKDQEERDLANGELDRKIAELKEALEQKASPVRKKLVDQKLAQLPSGLQEDLRKVLETPADKRDAVQKYLAEKFEKILKIEPADLRAADLAYGHAADDTERQIKLLEFRKLPEPKVRALFDRGEPSPTYISRRGDPANPGPLVGPGVPSVLTDGKTAFVPRPPFPGSPSTGRRLAFAKWLVAPDHPLTARVFVNRMWARHFGTGIVRSLGNFGHTGTPPTNPELLDWLATEFMQRGWSIKALHRLMITSSTYRQSSTVLPALEKSDPDNVLFSRMPLKRMDAEALYDSLLMISGQLDDARYGPPEPVQVRDDGLVSPIATDKGWRRSVYLAERRTEQTTLLESFDLPPMSPNCLERNTSTVAIQALHLLNNAMVENLAETFAQRVRKEVGDAPEKQVDRAYWIALSRPPTADEKGESLQALSRFKSLQKSTQSAPTADQKALASFCHALVNSAAYLYID